jgi:DNA-3-methyladenine glycosylase II
MNQKSLHFHFLSIPDNIIDTVLLKYGLIKIYPSQFYFANLVESVVCQQLSEKAGATIWKRFQELFPNKFITPKNVLEKSLEILRKSGISFAKAGYIQNIAEAYINNIITPDKFSLMTDDQVIAQLTQVKGIGRWTAEMFLIFSLGREDVFSFGDTGLIRAINDLYGKGNKMSPTQIEKIVRKWSPYRSYASLLLWKSLNNR